MKAFLRALLPLLFAELALSTSDPNPVDTWTPNPLEAQLRFETSTLTIYHPSYGIRNVSYYVADGNAIIDGDINFGPIDLLMAHAVDTQPLEEEESDSGIYQRALTHERGRFAWPSARVSYMFDSAYTERKLGATVQEAFRRWKAKAPYFTFKKVPNKQGRKGVITFKSAETGCWAFVGYQGKNADMRDWTCSWYVFSGRSSVLKLIPSHTGFWHEHQRADRERTVHFNCAALNPNCPAGQRLPPGRNCCGGPYKNGCCGDIGSTMQYRRDAFALNGQATLVPARPGVTVPSRNIGWPSKTDIARLCKLYPRQCRGKKKKIVEEDDLEEIDEFYGVGFSREELEEYLAS